MTTSPSVIFAADHGAPGGTSDDTQALLGVINYAPSGSIIVLENAVYSIQPDTLTWNKGVVLGGLRAVHDLSSNQNGPHIRLLNDGGFGIKIGNAANYPSGILISAGLQGVILDFNQKIFTDAALVYEGISKAIFSDNLLRYVGSDAAGRKSKAFRMRVVWDSVFSNNFIHSNFNSGAPLIYFDAFYYDQSGNCNNIRWVNNHIENVNGQIFASSPTSNIDSITWTGNKIEVPPQAIYDAVNNFFFDLDNATRCVIAGHNTLNAMNATATQWAGLVRIGHTARSFYNAVYNNNYYQCAGLEVINGVGANFSRIYDNMHVNAAASLTATNVSLERWDYTPAIDANNHTQMLFARSAMKGGWISACRATTAFGGMFAADNSSLFPTAAILRVNKQTTAGTRLLDFDSGSYSGLVNNLTVQVRVRRPNTTSLGTLQVQTSSSLITQFPTLASTLTWQIVSVTIPATGVAGMNQLSLQYGQGNIQVLDVDAVSFQLS